MAWADAARVSSRRVAQVPLLQFSPPHVLVLGSPAGTRCELQPARSSRADRYRRACGTGDDTGTVSISDVPIPTGIMMCERIGDDVTTTITETREDTNQPIMAKSAERLPGTSTRLRTRDDGCCSVNFLKYVLHIYNVVLFLSGLVVGGIGIWTVISKHSYVSLMATSTYPILAYALIVAGALAVVGSWLGCGGVTSENRCVLLMYVFVVMLVFVLEAGVGALARLYEEQVGPELKMNLNRTFLENYSVWIRETAAIDQMQMEFKCCGALRFEDWLVSEWHKDENVLKDFSLVPDSCCKTPTHLCGRRDHPSNIHYTGCIYKFLETTKDHLIILGAVGLGLSVLELFGIVLGSCLYIKLRHDFDD